MAGNSKDHVFWKVVMKLDSQAWFKSHIFILINSKKTGYHKTQQITPAAGAGEEAGLKVIAT